MSLGRILNRETLLPPFSHRKYPSVHTFPSGLWPSSRFLIMAEAAATVNTATTRYFCHKCSDEINPLPVSEDSCFLNLMMTSNGDLFIRFHQEFICPRCRSGFIEEVSDARSSRNDNVDSNDSSRR